MTKIEDTDWAKQFLLDAPISYPEAISRASKEHVEFRIECRDDLGEPLFAVIDETDDRGSLDFWFAAIPSRKAAEHLCSQMGWKLNSYDQ